MWYVFHRRRAAFAAVFAAISVVFAWPGGTVSLSPPTMENGKIRFRFDGASNQVLTLQALDSVPGQWTDFGFFLGTGTSVSVTSTIAGQARFFRLASTEFKALKLIPEAPLLTGGSVSLPDAVAGLPYAGEISAARSGVPPYSLRINGSAPSGINVSVISNGTVNSTVLVTGTGGGLAGGQRSQFKVEATDGSGATVTNSFDLRIVAPPPQLLTTALVFKAGETINTTLRATNGTGPLTWSIVSGSLSPGVALSQAGNVSGAVSTDDAEFQEAGRFTAMVRITDSQTDRVTGTPIPRSTTNQVVQVVRLSYQRNIYAERPGGPSLSTICYECHGSGFTPDISEFATTIIGMPSQDFNCPGRTYIVPGSPENSLIYQKLRGPDCGQRMPFGGPYFENTRLSRMERWIRELTAQDTD